MNDRANLICYQRGSSLLEGLLAIILFSIGLLSLLMLLSATLIESSNARYRIEASLLISDLVSHLWINDPTKRSNDHFDYVSSQAQPAID